jgi:hypothetical protein
MTLVYGFLYTLNIISSINQVNKYEPLSETGLTTVMFSKLYLPISFILNAVFVQFWGNGTI